MGFREVIMYIAVAVALVAVAVGVANRSAIGKQVPLGSVVVSRGISTHGIMIIEVVTDSATVNVMGPTLVPSGAIAFMVYRDRDRFLVANRITYGRIIKIARTEFRKMGP